MGIEVSPRVGRIAAWLARHVELALDTVGLSPAQYRLLVLLAEASEDKLAASVLADKLAVSRPSVTAVVDGLVARGLVARHPDAHDRRRIGHQLTRHGRTTLKAADEAVESRLHAITSPSTASQARAALEGLQRWQQVLDSYRVAKRAESFSERSKPGDRRRRVER